MTICNCYCVGSHRFTMHGHSVADSNEIFLELLVRCVLVKLKCLGILIKLLDNICEIGVQALVTSFVLVWWFFMYMSLPKYRDW